MTARFRHFVYGLSIESDLQLPGCEDLPDHTREPDLFIRWAPRKDDAGWDPAFGPEPRLRNEPKLRIGECGQYCLAWGREIRCVMDAKIKHLTLYSAQHKAPYLPPLIVGIVLGLICVLRGRICLHGSVLGWKEQAIALLGNSGAGKSTLSETLIARGYELISDDIVTFASNVESDVRVETGARGLRLYRSFTASNSFPDTPRTTIPHLGKLLLDFSKRPLSRTGPWQLKRVFVLEPHQKNSSPKLSPLLESSRALQSLIRYWYPPGFLSCLTPHHLAQLAVVAQSVPVRSLHHPRQRDQLDPMVALLEA